MTIARILLIARGGILRGFPSLNDAEAFDDGFEGHDRPEYGSCHCIASQICSVQNLALAM